MYVIKQNTCLKPLLGIGVTICWFKVDDIMIHATECEDLRRIDLILDGVVDLMAFSSI